MSHLQHQLDSNHLHDKQKSAHRIYHSTETALPKVCHDIITAMNNNSCAVLLIFDLWADLNVIDHYSHQASRVPALGQWLDHQFLMIFISAFGILQGSVLVQRFTDVFKSYRWYLLQI